MHCHTYRISSKIKPGLILIFAPKDRLSIISGEAFFSCTTIYRYSFTTIYNSSHIHSEQSTMQVSDVIFYRRKRSDILSLGSQIFKDKMSSLVKMTSFKGY